MALFLGTTSSASASSASASESDSLAARRKMPYPKSDIKVNLKDHYNSKVYTSGSPLTGDVTITTKRQVRFDSIQVVLIGSTKTNFEGMNVPQEVTHTFLKMVMPIPESTYPVPRVLETGRTYNIPFHFVIPQQLTINACNHTRLSDQLQDHHLVPPPSIGGWQKDDMAPHMARVEYTIKARVLREDELGATKTRIMEATQTIQVLPASVEEPPLNVADKDKLYAMAKTKTLRRNILSTKLGRLTAEAVQPGAAVLSSDGRRTVSHPTALIKLTFEPESSSSSSSTTTSSSSSSSSHTPTPPQISSVTGKVTAHTFFSSGTINNFPNLSEWNLPFGSDRRGQFFMSTALPAISFAEQPAWTSPSTRTARRDSGYCGSDEGESNGLGGRAKNKSAKPRHTKEKSSSSSTTTTTTATKYETTLSIPISLPTDKKTFVPTFHSCIASRVYSLQLSIGVSVRGSTNTITLSLPLQVAIEGAAPAAAHIADGGDGAVVGSPADGPPSFEEAAADEHLRPRVLQVPGEGYRDRGFVSGGSTGLLGRGQPVAAGGDELPGYGAPGYRRRMD
ncbi:Bul1 C-terminal domain-containing protein [Madurella fahalii]|uniref:Bul1 C-terminal domain-containing protein n=1 Tax=Madurella fahalii TaxID=1157608 RepID=A0ABQ0GLX5_9PEZI